MTEPMTPERLAEIRKRAIAATECPKAEGPDRKHVWSGSSFTHAECSACRYTRPRGERAEEAAELLAEVDRLKAQAARFDAEWGVEWGSQRSVYPYESEPAARRAAADHPNHVVVRRLVGPWRPVTAPAEESAR